MASAEIQTRTSSPIFQLERREQIGAVSALDWPVAMGVVIITAGLTILANFLADIAYVYVDPRIRY